MNKLKIDLLPLSPMDTEILEAMKRTQLELLGYIFGCPVLADESLKEGEWCMRPNSYTNSTPPPEPKPAFSATKQEK